MKINLPFHSHSVVQVITNAYLMILIVSVIHIISVFTTFDSHIENIKIIDKLTSLKISTTGLIYASTYHPHDMPILMQQIETQIIDETLFNNAWFNTQQVNQHYLPLASQWSEIHTSIDQHRFTDAQQLLPLFYASLEDSARQYQLIATKNIRIIHMIEFIGFLITILVGAGLYLYSKKQVVEPIKQLVANVQAIKAHKFDLAYPSPNNEIGTLSKGIEDAANRLHHLITSMQKQVSAQTIELEKANQAIEFLYSISQQLSTVKLTSPILFNALNALAKQSNLQKLCLELNNGTFITSKYGCAGIDEKMHRIPIIINRKPYGYLNYVLKEGMRDQYSLIESFTGLVARALYQEEYSLQAQKILLMEERNIIARELHDSIAQSLSFLNIQCTLLHRQVDGAQQQQAQQTIGDIKEAISDAYIQLRSLLSTFRLNVTESNFKEALLTMIKTLQKQTEAPITIKQFESYFYTDASQHIHLLQIIREAIINAIKHSKCSQIEISCIITAQNKVWISIIDDGQGIVNNRESGNHYGLSIMKQRADELGATLSFNSLTQGTEVKLIFPYKNSTLTQGTDNV